MALEEKMANKPEDGIVLGRKKCWSIAYADDVALVATSSSELKGIVRKLYKEERIGIE